MLGVDLDIYEEECKEREKLEEQLEQAKELIKSLIEEVTSYEEINDYDKCGAVVEAEQFLKQE